MDQAGAAGGNDPCKAARFRGSKRHHGLSTTQSQARPQLASQQTPTN
jgi:hypothetical protein